MARFWESLSESSRPKWAELYKQFKGREWEKPLRDERAIQCVGKLEDTEEIKKIMKETPNYTIDSQGREG